MVNREVPLPIWQARSTEPFAFSVTAIAVNRPISGAALAALNHMFDLSAANLIGNLLFGAIGFVAFAYGKRMTLWKMMFCGLALMIYPYFIANTVAMYVAGTVGSVALFFLRD